MCYATGSLDQATKACPMCKVFPHTRCPHTHEICRNRTSHPRFDVLHLRNAEVDWFNGCGYCKWAKTNPPPKSAGYYNPGWPGCCRPPLASEYTLIQAADWRSVSIVHHVPIPPGIKAALDSLSGGKGSPPPAAGAGRIPTNIKSSPTLDRKNSGNGSPPSKSSSVSAKSAAIPIPAKTRSGGSPQLTSSSLSRASGTSPSVLSSLAAEQHQSQRRQTLTADSADRQGLQSSQASPTRKMVDLEGPVSPRRNSGGRSSAVVASSMAVKATADTHRRASVSNAPSPPAKSSPPTRPSDRPAVLSTPRPVKKEANISSASSSSGGSSTDGTVTSDGGFTDYLSDESEAELQRQAEARAALLAQNQAEEHEFRAARQALAHVDLRPPKSWNPTNLTNTSSTRPTVLASGSHGKV